MSYINNRELERIQRSIVSLKKRLPGIMGTSAVEMFKGSFRRQGWIVGKNQVQKWEPRKSKRDNEGRALLIKSGRLRRGIRQSRRGKDVAITNDTPYARAHNEGAEIDQQIPITPKMRKFFWAKWYETQDERWKAMALSKGPLDRHITIPQRQFMGVNEFLEERILRRIENELNTIFKRS